MSDRMADTYDQFKPQPAVDRSPIWPTQPPQLEVYIDSVGANIVECAVCVVIEADADEPGVEIDGGRPYRAVTAVIGTPVCREHLPHLDRAVCNRGLDVPVIELAARYAFGLDA